MHVPNAIGIPWKRDVGLFKEENGSIKTKKLQSHLWKSLKYILKKKYYQQTDDWITISILLCKKHKIKISITEIFSIIFRNIEEFRTSLFVQSQFVARRQTTISK